MEEINYKYNPHLINSAKSTIISKKYFINYGSLLSFVLVENYLFYFMYFNKKIIFFENTQNL